MRFRCDRDTLADALGTAARAATGRTGTLPVLAGLRLELVDDLLSVTGSDLDLTIQLSVTVGGDENGSTVVRARMATDIVRSLPSGKVELVAGDDDATIRSGRSRFSVRVFSVDDYPRVSPSGADAVTVDATVFADAVRQVVKAASTDEARPVLTGVLLTSEADGLRMVATDSYRLAVRDLGDATMLGSDQKVLVPAKALGELQRLLGASDKLTVRLGDRDATFEVGGTRLTTRLIEGEFPNYRQLIPASHPNTLTVGRDPLLEALRRMKLMAHDATPVRLEMAQDTVSLKAINQEEGSAEEVVDAQLTGNDMTVAFNVEYLAAGIEAAGTEEITLHTLDPLKPAVIRGVGRQDFLYLLMPVRVP